MKIRIVVHGGGLEGGIRELSGVIINVLYLDGVLDKWVHTFVKTHLIVQ